MSLNSLIDDPVFVALCKSLAAFLFCVVLYPFYIKWLHSKQMGQFIREEGPASHAKKAKTPTMGGLLFIAGIIFSSLLPLYQGGFLPDEKFNNQAGALLVLAAATLCGLLGFADDFGKITSRSNTGISGKFRLLCEFALGLVLSLALYFLNLVPPVSLGINVGSEELSTISFLLGGFGQYIYLFAFVPFLMAASTNALNLHDGMDGLAAGTSLIVMLDLAFMLVVSGYYLLGWIAAAALGALLAFLVYNRYPAKIFMGDTGSLFLGALMAGLVVAGGLVLWFIPLSLIYVVETVSVILQVLYFKASKAYVPERSMSRLSLLLYKLTHKLPGEGKRLFRMSPIHHHFEAIAQEKGKKEWEVVLSFWVIQLLISAVTLFFFLHHTAS
ncbi:MAG: phospho-N-acetylmuramoyl-pentapeptide-transferase [Candidatus Obscuribacterales bacterium]|nr:phospho-N-acetylmuramoyl-pentapeptide-transferase [Candidatus Obscuribacterales bacterium]